MNNIILPSSSKAYVVFWFRRDLRFSDNKGLYYALTSGYKVLPVFIFDTVILNNLKKDDSRVEFIYLQIKEMQQFLHKQGKNLLILYGKPLDLFKKLKEDYSLKAVFTNKDHEPYGIKRDREIEDYLKMHQIEFHSYLDHLLFDKKEVIKSSGDPYTVFTPYYNKTLQFLKPEHLDPYQSEKHLEQLTSMTPTTLMSLSVLGFQSSGRVFPSKEIPEDKIENYHFRRDFPGKDGTSRLGVHLRFGTISIRRLFAMALQLNHVFAKELLWREFYAMILLHFPYVVQHSFKPVYDRIEWLNDSSDFELWKTGNTGYPFVDAGMRQLKETGFMHNRVRMVVASFLTKHLMIDWRWGEAWFAQNLLDYELSSNNGGWQWSAGCGCDAAPYFRIFNPIEQQKKFDPEKTYIQKWLGDDPHYKMNKPMIDHGFARQRCLSIYKKALSG